MAADAPDDLHALDVLPAGTRFGELEILRTLGVGGFGIVYLAQDHALQRQVAIKEYMPGQLAQRGGGSQVSVRAGSYQETFDIGRRSFVNEARLLARFDHRALLKVYQFWEANGTAYMAMPYLQGLTLRQTRQAMTGTPDEAWMLNLLLPLLDGLTLLHAEGVLHRDIAPDNILLPAVGKDGGADPILLDFGAARRAIGDRTQTLTAILKPSYAPIEQYAEATALRQGPWTDVYALGAVMHYMVTGRPPPPATARAVADDYEPLAGQHLPGLSPTFLAAIDAALGVRPQDRPQSAAALRAALLGQAALPAAVTARADEPTLIDPGRRAATPAAALDLDFDDAPAPPSSSPAAVVVDEMRAERVVVTAAPPTLNTGGGAARWLVVVALLAAAALAGWWLLLRTPAAAPASPLAVQAPVLLPAAAPSVVAVDAAVDAAEQPPSASAPASSPASAAALVPAVAAPAVASAATSAAAVPKPAGARVVRPPPLLREPVVKSTPSATTGTTAPAPKLPPPMPRQDSSMTLPTPAAPAAAAQPAPALLERAPPVAQTTASASPAAGIPAGPREACGKRVFIAMSMCIARECRNPAYAEHPECVRLREIDEQRGRRIGP